MSFIKVKIHKVKFSGDLEFSENFRKWAILQKKILLLKNTHKHVSARKLIVSLVEDHAFMFKIQRLFGSAVSSSKL
jgi:hypothetical protein